MADVKEIFSTWLAGGDNTLSTENSDAISDTVLASDSTDPSMPDDTSPDSVEGQAEQSEPASSDVEATPQTSKDKAAAAAGKGDREKIVISDDKGRREVEIDYGNKDQIRKAYQMAYGARKWQAERDAARAEVAQAKAASSDIKSNWDALESAFSKQGIEGVVNLLEGRPDAYASHITKQIERRKFIERATPEELDALAAKEHAEVKSREAAELERKYAELEERVTRTHAETEEKALQGRVHPAFEKHRFADKLGDPSSEAMFDRMLWKEALDNLTPYEEKYGSASAIPQEIVEKEFRVAASLMRKKMGIQAEKKAAQIIDQKKQEATENVQSRVQAGYKPSGAAAEIKDLLKKGDTMSLIRNWGRLGK